MRKKTLLKIFTMYILGIVLIQSIVPFALIAFSKVKTNMEDNIIRVDNIAVENRQLVLENDMIEKWSSIHKESSTFQVVLENLLNEKQIDINGLLDSKEMQQEYLERVFPEMIETLQYNTMSGIFMILTNHQDINQKADYCGFFVRDSDPENRVESNADMLMEKGSKQLAHSEQISLDNAWSTDFTFEGSGVRAADDFFYKPYEAALQYPNAAPVNLGYWAKPFILQDDYMDNHAMITYSVPMIYNDVVYGILGVEVSTAFMTKYFELRDLDAGLNAGYALAVDSGNGEFDAF